MAVVAEARYSFTGGRPSPEDFPIQGLIDAAAAVLPRLGKELIAYPDQHGGPQHRGLIEVASRRFAEREGTPLPEKDIIVSEGSGGSIVALTEHLTEPGDTVLCEELTYMGSLGVFRRNRLNIVGIPVDPVDGMDMAALEQALTRLEEKGIQPKFIYTIANYQNPTGAILTRDRREQMLALAKRFAVPILEDDCYGDVHFEADPPPPALYTLSGGSNVAYIGSCSKIMGPGLRLGYMCIPPELDGIRSERISAKASGLSSMIVAEYLKTNLQEHLQRHNEVLKAKRDLMLELLEEHLGEICSWNQPRGGLFCWIRLPVGLDVAALEKAAAAQEVVFTPGRDFHYAKEEMGYLRLSYTHMSHEDIQHGITRLADCIKALA